MITRELAGRWIATPQCEAKGCLDFRNAHLRYFIRFKLNMFIVFFVYMSDYLKEWTQPTIKPAKEDLYLYVTKNQKE